MSTPTMVPMISPQGDIGDVPSDQVDKAVKGGFKMGVELQTDDGETGVVPVDQAHQAMSSGRMHLVPPKIQKPAAPDMQKSLLAQSLSPGTERSAIANPQQPAEQFALDNPEQQGKLAGAAATGAAGSAAQAVLPAVLPHTIEGVKAIGTWAAKNPVQAYILFQVVKELLPGAKKAMGIVKEAPVP